MAKFKMVQLLGMIVTNNCNLECAHCLRGCACNQKMSDEVIEATLSNFDYINTLSICGGEITLALDIVEKIINYVIEHQILVDEITYTINGTVYTKKFIDLMDYSNEYLLKVADDKKEKVRTSFAISWDPYHKEAVIKAGLKEQFIDSVAVYSESPYYAGPRELVGKLFREGRAVNLPDELTVPLRPMNVYMTYYRKYKNRLGFIKRVYDEQGGDLIMGPVISVNPEGIVTECDASTEHQSTIYNYGNVLYETIEDICRRRSIILHNPKEIPKKMFKELKRYSTYDE